MRSFAQSLLAVLIVYAGGYLVFRQTHVAVWQKDQRAYVLFPDSSVGRALYYAWRPLSHIDLRSTATGAHIGPHRE
jgi:hypothetical protein